MKSTMTSLFLLCHQFCMSIFACISLHNSYSVAFSLSPSSHLANNARARSLRSKHRGFSYGTCSLASSFYDDFEDFQNKDDDDDDDKEGDGEKEGDDDDDDDDNEAIELDDAAVRDFRSRMGNLYDEDEEDVDTSILNLEEGLGEEKSSAVDDLISFATKKKGDKKEEPTEWAIPFDSIEAGVVLLANPAKFCTDIGDGSSSPSPALLAKFGLTLPPPSDLGADRRADLLPVLTLLERHPLKGAQGVLLNRRTGYLLGDLEQPTSSDDEDGVPTFSAPKLGAFMIQPLWFGGTSANSGDSGGNLATSSGLDMLHVCPYVQDAKKLTEDGLYWGGDPGQAQEAMTDPKLDRALTGFDFKFFVQSTRWFPLQLEKEIRDGTWFVASVSKELLFKSRDRMGTRRAQPLWSEIMEMMGGEYKEIRDSLYGDE